MDTRGSAECLLKAVCDFSLLGFLSFWCDILEEMDLTQKYLQREGISLDKCSGVTNGLKFFLRDQQNENYKRILLGMPVNNVKIWGYPWKDKEE